MDGYCAAHRPGGQERMRELAKRAVRARQLQTEGLAPAELPPLEDHADAKLWLERLGRAVATGRLGERAAQASIRAVSEWVKAHEGELTAHVVDDVEAELERLKAELSGRPLLAREK